MNIKKTQRNIKLISVLLTLAGCGLNPQSADLGLDETLPEAKTTIYQQAINQLGLMTSIYGSPPLMIMAKDIFDNTGTSIATNAEIPRDITEMVKSTLNAIGGSVQYIPYEPDFMLNTAKTGYSRYGDKTLPEVILSGGITEFDRGLVTKGDSLEFDIEIAKEYGISFSDEEKASLASVTLDFNLIDFKTFAGIPRIQAVNGIKLHKATREDSIGFTVKSATFGAKGEIKKVQGRHSAVRLLVQLSMLQMIGRYEKLPYWKLIPGAVVDDVVIDQVLADYYSMNKAQQLLKVQELLFLHGFNINPTGLMDANTQNALQKFAQNHNLPGAAIDQKMYLTLYENIPISAATRQRRVSLNNLFKMANVEKKSVNPSVNEKTIEQTPVTKVDSVATSTKGILKLTTDKTNYKIGENLKINFSVNKPMYVRIVVINSDGKIDSIFPNAYQSDNFCKPGKKYSIPSPNSDFTLDIGGPAGTDKLRAVASEKPIPAELMSFTSDGQFNEDVMTELTTRASFDYNIQ